MQRGNFFSRRAKLWPAREPLPKTHWYLINIVLNKAKIPIIPPLLENGLFVTDLTQKAQVFKDHFILQCTTTNSEMPEHTPSNPTMIDSITISEEKIIKIIRSLNPSDATLVAPLKIILTNCLRCGVFPQLWKHANIVPVHKKNEKNLEGNYHCFQPFEKYSKKLIYDSLYSHLVSSELLNPNQSGFHPSDSTVNQLISITHVIFKAFDCNPLLDVRSVYLHISKTF